MRVNGSKDHGTRLFKGRDITEEYIVDFLRKKPVIVKDLGVSAIDFEDCCSICKPKRLIDKVIKETGFTLMDFRPVNVMKAAFYMVIHKCVYERVEFRYSRGSVGLYYFPEYYSKVVKDSSLKAYYSFDTTDPKAKLGFLQIRPNFSPAKLKAKGYERNPVKIIVDTKVYKDIALLINSQADLSDLPVVTTKDLAIEMQDRFPMYSLSLLEDYINEGFITYTKLSIDGIPVSMTYYERGHSKEEYYKFQIRNFTNVYKAVKYAFLEESLATALQHTITKEERDFKCRKQKNINAVRESQQLLNSASIDTLKTWAKSNTDYYIYTNYLEPEELIKLYNCPIHNEYSIKEQNYWEVEEERLTLPI